MLEAVIFMWVPLIAPVTPANRLRTSCVCICWQAIIVWMASTHQHVMVAFFMRQGNKATSLSSIQLRWCCSVKWMMRWRPSAHPGHRWCLLYPSDIIWLTACHQTIQTHSSSPVILIRVSHIRVHILNTVFSFTSH